MAGGGMVNLPDYLTRYYVAGEDPFTSLNDHPLERANEIKRAHCLKNGIGGFYAQDDYLVHRREIENWIHACLVEKGGRPVEKVPVYMTLGDSPAGPYDIRGDIQKGAAEIRIPLEALDLAQVTFTYPDSMYEFIVEGGKIIGGRRTNRPKVYLYHELSPVFKRYGPSEFYVEAQVWNRQMLHKYCKEERIGY